MSGQINEIKKRIQATKNTRKITKAMKLVAASKMRQFQKKAVSARSYSFDILKVLHNSLREEDLSNVFTEQREEGKTLFVIYTSDKGLCGGLNSRLMKTLFSSDKWNEMPEDERLLMTIGKKSADFAKYNKIAITKSFNSLNEKMSPLESLEIVDEIIKYWMGHKVKEVIMISPHYKNSLVFYPIMKTYLPFSEEMIEQHIGAEEKAEGLEIVREEIFSDEPPMIYEPDEAIFKEKLIEQVVQTLFLQSFFELKATEYSSRMIAMQNATDAASDMIDTLTLKFNKARQAAITQEIAEIVGGSMA